MACRLKNQPAGMVFCFIGIRIQKRGPRSGALSKPAVAPNSSAKLWAIGKANPDVESGLSNAGCVGDEDKAAISRELSA